MLPCEISTVIKMMIKQYSMFIISFMGIMMWLGGSIFSIGLTLAVFNFILSGVILKSTIEKRIQLW